MFLRYIDSGCNSSVIFFNVFITVECFCIHKACIRIEWSIVCNFNRSNRTNYVFSTFNFFNRISVCCYEVSFYSNWITIIVSDCFSSFLILKLTFDMVSLIRKKTCEVNYVLDFAHSNRRSIMIFSFVVCCSCVG